MAKIPNCEMCGKRFTWYYRWRHTINYCRKVVCRDCVKGDKMAKIPNCEMCGKRFTWYYRWRHTCNYCRKVVCRDCVKRVMEIYVKSIFYGQILRLCRGCYEKLQSEFRKAIEVIVVGSSHIGGHKIIKILGEISTSIQYENFDNAKFELQYNAFKLGANAVLNYRYIKHTHSMATGRRGTYYYSLFTARGTAAIVRKNERL